MKKILYIFFYLYVFSSINYTIAQSVDSLRFFNEDELDKIAENVSKIIFAKSSLEWAQENILRYANEEMDYETHKDLVINRLQYLGYSNSIREVIVHKVQKLNPLKNNFILFHCFESAIIIPSDSSKDTEERLMVSHPPHFYLAVDYIGRFYDLSEEDDFNVLVNNYFISPITKQQAEEIGLFYLNTIHGFSFYGQYISNIEINESDKDFHVSVEYSDKSNDRKDNVNFTVKSDGKIEPNQ